MSSVRGETLFRSSRIGTLPLSSLPLSLSSLPSLHPPRMSKTASELTTAELESGS